MDHICLCKNKDLFQTIDITAGTVGSLFAQKLFFLVCVINKDGWSTRNLERFLMDGY